MIGWFGSAGMGGRADEVPDPGGARGRRRCRANEGSDGVRTAGTRHGNAGNELGRRESRAQGSAGVSGRTAGRGVSATGADLPALREASVEQRRRFDFSAHGVRDSAAAEPTLESVRLSVDRERDLSTASMLAAWANHTAAA